MFEVMVVMFFRLKLHKSFTVQLVKQPKSDFSCKSGAAVMPRIVMYKERLKCI